jgi:anti-sigma B factor antagonist
MPLNVRFDGDLAILSNFGRLINDPRHFDAGRDVQELLDQGYRHFVLELAGVRDMGPTSLGLLTTLTRLVRRQGGDAVLANVGRGTEDYINMMQMDTYWELFETVREAKAFFQPGAG